MNFKIVNKEKIKICQIIRIFDIDKDKIYITYVYVPSFLKGAGAGQIYPTSWQTIKGKGNKFCHQNPNPCAYGMPKTSKT